MTDPTPEMRRRLSVVPDLELHPLCLIMPEHSEAQFEELKADIKANKLRVPVVIFQDKILDGRGPGAARYPSPYFVEIERYGCKNLRAGNSIAHIDQRQRLQAEANPSSTQMGGTSAGPSTPTLPALSERAQPDPGRRNEVN